MNFDENKRQLIIQSLKNKLFNGGLSNEYVKITILIMSLTINSLATASSSQNKQVTSSSVMPIDFSSISTPKHQLALMQALSEVCPTLLKLNQRSNFNAAYNAKLHKLMPAVANPDNALKYLSTKSDYRKLRANLKTWTLSYSKAENRAICLDLSRSEF